MIDAMLYAQMYASMCVSELEYNIEYAFNKVKTQDTMRGSQPYLTQWVPNTMGA